MATTTQFGVERFGGFDAYAASQNRRYHEALRTNDTKTQEALRNDARRVGFTLTAPATITAPPATTISTGTAGTGNASTGNATLDNILKAFSNMQQGDSASRLRLQELMTAMPTTTGLTPEQQLQRAQEHANLIFDPQVSALARGLEQLRQSALGQKDMLRASHTGVQERTQRLMGEAQTQAVESAIARGAGRSGVTEWLQARLQAPVLERHQQLEAEHISRLADVADRLALAERQNVEQLSEIEALRGRTAAQKQITLEEQAHARSVGDWERAFSATQQLAALEADDQRLQFQRIEILMPYMMDTVAQRNAAQSDVVQTIGEVTPNIGASIGTPAATGLNLDNERRYLEGLVRTGNAGQRAWAINRARELGVTLAATGTPTTPATTAPTTPATATQNVTVRSGDTLSAIARRNNTTVANLQRLNPQITNPDRIAIGAVIRVA